MNRESVGFVVLLCLGLVAPFTAQAEPLAYPWDSFNIDRRWDALGGSLSQDSINWHTLTTLQWSGQDTPVQRATRSVGEVEITLFDPYFWSSMNSGFPYGGNDGAAWQGRGVNAGLSGGAAFAYRGFTVTILPEFWAAENRAFDLMPAAAGTTEFGYQATGIDQPQRFGDDPLFKASPGQSEIRYTWRRLTVGLGSQSVWFGPATRNSILLSNNAGGVPRLDVGLLKAPTRIGYFEALAWWGRLQESDYFDDDSGNDVRLHSGVALSWQASSDRGPSIGLNRQVLQDWRSPTFYDLVISFNPSPIDSTFGSDNRDQRVSATISWRLPTYGLEVYGEWARNDFSAARQLALAPEHTDGFVLGFRQRFADRADGTFWSIEAEIFELMQSRTYEINELGRSQSGFYTNGQVRQGHTHLGQVLGARSGSGSDNQFIRVARHQRWGTVGWMFERRSIDKDFIYGASGRQQGDQERLQIELVTGPDARVRFGNVSLEAQILWLNRLNYNYVEQDDRYSVYGSIGVRYGFS